MGPQRQSGRLGEEKNHLPQGIPDGPARGLVTTLTTLSRLPTYCHIASDLSNYEYIPHSATYSAPQLNNQPLNIY